MKLKSIAVDPKAVEDGAWVKNLPEMGDLELKVRGQNSSVWKARRRKLINALPRNLRNRADGLPQTVEDNLLDTLLIEAGLLDWKNFELDDGAKPYSKELAAKTIKDPVYALFRDAVLTATVRVGTDEAEADEELAKNSATSSSGSFATGEVQPGS
jgi:hypothetical protein